MRCRATVARAGWALVVLGIICFWKYTSKKDSTCELAKTVSKVQYKGVHVSVPGTGMTVFKSQNCSSVFPDMLHGHWVARKDINEGEVKAMDEYLVNIRAEYRIPPSLQRADGRCGNLSYDSVTQYHHMGFKSICNPNGPTPCCSNFVCVNRSKEDCQCPTCFDSRVPVHAELSVWVPDVPECRPKTFSPRHACELLRGSALLLAGDSFLRHVFVTLVMLLTDNFQDGALRPGNVPGRTEHCRGMYQINGHRCRVLLDHNRTLCSGSVTAIYSEVFTADQVHVVLSALQSVTSQKQRVLLLVGIGIHNDFRSDVVWKQFIQPLQDAVVTRKSRNRSYNHPKMDWPKFLWASSHAPGLLKTPVLPAQSFEGVQIFNKEIAHLLAPYCIPILDTFNMTAPLHSVDGTHYGYGANMMKVQILLNWIRERQDRGEW